MTTDRPSTGSTWAAHCPDAYPYSWYEALGLTHLPGGFTRFATDEEAALIAGGQTPADGKAPARQQNPPSRGTVERGKEKRKGERFALLNGFIDFELASLTQGEVKVWLILYRDSREGIARTGQADIARRSGLTVRGAQKVLDRLTKKGLVVVARRGGLRAGPSSYRVQLPPACPAAP